MKCKLTGCEKEIRVDYDSKYCSKEHAFIDVHRYTGESLQEYLKRRKSLQIKSNKV